MLCTRCGGTGFLNIDQVDAETLAIFDDTGDHDVILEWIADRERRMKEAGGCSCHINPPCHYCVDLVHDVSMCDCCGDGENWYNLPGYHDLENSNSPFPECY